MHCARSLAVALSPSLLFLHYPLESRSQSSMYSIQAGPGLGWLARDPPSSPPFFASWERERIFLSLPLSLPLLSSPPSHTLSLSPAFRPDSLLLAASASLPAQCRRARPPCVSSPKIVFNSAALFFLRAAQQPICQSPRASLATHPALAATAIHHNPIDSSRCSARRQYPFRSCLLYALTSSIVVILLIIILVSTRQLHV